MNVKEIYRFLVQAMGVKCTFIIWEYLYRTKRFSVGCVVANVRIVPEITMLQGGEVSVESGIPCNF